MSKWTSCGEDPPNDLEAIRARRKDHDLLQQHLPVILANSDRVLEAPRYFFCQPRTAYMSSLWIFGGGGPIPIGVLLLLWKALKMIFVCPACGGKVYAVGISGSVLSSCGSIWGPCLNCNQGQHLRRDRLGETILAIGPLLRNHRNEPVIEKGERPRFDWKEGVVGESTPARVIIPAVEPVNLETLVTQIERPANANQI